MSVIIKGMEMPKSCEDCGFYGIECEGGCALTKYYVLRKKDEDRPKWCPLVDLPEPHGNLVDADTVEFEGEHEHGYTWTGKIVVHREKENENG